MLILNEKLQNQQSKLQKAETTIDSLRKYEFENEVWNVWTIKTLSMLFNIIFVEILMGILRV